MSLRKFQRPSLCVFPHELFTLDPETTLEQIGSGDDAQRIVTASSRHRHP